MEGLENKRRSNNNLKQTDEMAELDNTKETVLPSWMCESEAYEPDIDKDGFITKSTQAVLGVLAKLKWNAGKDRHFSASPSLKLCFFIYFAYRLLKKLSVFINYDSRDNPCTCKLSGICDSANLFRNVWSSCIFCSDLVTGSIYGKSTDTTHNRNKSISVCYPYRNVVCRNILE